MALCLHRTAHEAERHRGFAASGHEARNDGVERALVGADLVGMSSFEGKSIAAVLQADPGSGHDDAEPNPE